MNSTPTKTTLTSLKTACRKAGLPTNGSKAELWKRTMCKQCCKDEEAVAGGPCLRVLVDNMKELDLVSRQARPLWVERVGVKGKWWVPYSRLHEIECECRLVSEVTRRLSQCIDCPYKRPEFGSQPGKCTWRCQDVCLCPLFRSILPEVGSEEQLDASTKMRDSWSAAQSEWRKLVCEPSQFSYFRARVDHAPSVVAALPEDILDLIAVQSIDQDKTTAMIELRGNLHKETNNVDVYVRGLKGSLENNKTRLVAQARHQMKRQKTLAGSDKPYHESTAVRRNREGLEEDIARQTSEIKDMMGMGGWPEWCARQLARVDLTAAWHHGL